MIIEQIVNSVFKSNTWVIKHESSKKTWLVDCGDFAQIESSLNDKYDLKGIFLTHSHFDHIYGLNDVLSKWPFCHIYTNEFGFKSLLSDKLNFSKYHEKSFELRYPENVVLISDKDNILLHDDIYVECIYTPGHDNSCFCYKIEKCLFTGDVYIPGIKTVTSLRGGNNELQSHSMGIVEGELKYCEKIFPGHNDMQVISDSWL